MIRGEGTSSGAVSTSGDEPREFRSFPRSPVGTRTSPLVSVPVGRGSPGGVICIPTEDRGNAYVTTRISSGRKGLTREGDMHSHGGPWERVRHHSYQFR
jgi:hypothetical protein